MQMKVDDLRNWISVASDRIRETTVKNNAMKVMSNTEANLTVEQQKKLYWRETVEVSSGVMITW